jgi:hypothetical protein
MNKEWGVKLPEHEKGNSNNAPRVFKGDQKPKRYNDDALNKSLLGKRVKITLINSQIIEGTLSNLGIYDLSVSRKVQEKFGALIRENEKVIIVLKASIATVEVN